MYLRRLVVPSLLLAISVCAFAQGKWGALRVRVTYTNGRAAEGQFRVQLLDSSTNSPVKEAFTGESGELEFAPLGIGGYHIVVSGEGIETTDSGYLEVDERKSSQSVDIMVKRTGETDMPASKESHAPSVAAVDLNVPQAATKEFDKASQSMAKENWKKAIEQLNRAVQLYPQYAAAYNNLGIAYGRSGDRAREREELQRAITINDHFAAAYANLAKMDIADHNFAEAETLLTKAASSDPANSATTILLANVELLNKHFEEAIANCHKAHSSSNDPHALAHYIAARAWEHENRLDDAVNELQSFLKEEATGSRADAVRKELTALENHNVRSAAVPGR